MRKSKKLKKAHGKRQFIVKSNSLPILLEKEQKQEVQQQQVQQQVQQVQVEVQQQVETQVEKEKEVKIMQEQTKQQKNITPFKSLDLTGRLVQNNDIVAYVYQNKQGKTVTITGVVVNANKKGFKVMTQNGVINVRNVIKIQDSTKKAETRKINKAQKLGLLATLKGLFTR